MGVPGINNNAGNNGQKKPDASFFAGQINSTKNRSTFEMLVRNAIKNLTTNELVNLYKKLDPAKRAEFLENVEKMLLSKVLTWEGYKDFRFGLKEEDVPEGFRIPATKDHHSKFSSQECRAHTPMWREQLLKSDPEEYESQGKKVTSLALDVAPGVGDLKNLVEGISNKDLVTGEEMGPFTRFFCFLGAAPLVPGTIKKLGEPIDKALKLGAKAAEDAGHIAKDGAKASETVKKVIKKPAEIKQMHQAANLIPHCFSTAHINIHCNDPRLAEMMKTKILSRLNEHIKRLKQAGVEINFDEYLARYAGKEKAFSIGIQVDKQNRLIQLNNLDLHPSLCKAVSGGEMLEGVFTSFISYSMGSYGGFRCTMDIVNPKVASIVLDCEKMGIKLDKVQVNGGNPELRQVVDSCFKTGLTPDSILKLMVAAPKDSKAPHWLYDLKSVGVTFGIPH